MARVVRVKRKRRPSLLLYGLGVFAVAFTLYGISSIYLRQYNVELSKEISIKEEEIKSLSVEKEALHLAIDKAIYKSNVVELAKKDNMKRRKENIVYIKAKNN